MACCSKCGSPFPECSECQEQMTRVTSRELRALGYRFACPTEGCGRTVVVEPGTESEEED